MKMQQIILVAGVLLGLGSSALAEITFSDPKFKSQVFATGIPTIRKLAFGPGGSFGNDLFVVSNDWDSQPVSDRILTVNSEGTVSTWANSLDGPYGFTFSSSGTYGSYLYTGCEDTPDGLYRIDPLTQSVSSRLVEINEATGVVLSTGGSFGNYLYVAQSVGAGTTNYVWRVDSDFGKSEFVTLGTNAHSTDLLFSDGGDFGNYLYVAGQLDHAGSEATDLFIRRIDSAGNISAFSEVGLEPCRGFMAFSPGGMWGDNLYVSVGQSIYLVNASGEVSIFASGFTSLSGLAFAPDASSLYVGQGTDQNNIIVITPEPATLSLLALGACLPLLRKRR